MLYHTKLYTKRDTRKTHAGVLCLKSGFTSVTAHYLQAATSFSGSSTTAEINSNSYSELSSESG